MEFKQSLIERLEEKMEDKFLEILPSGYQKIGDIILLSLNEKLNKFKKEIGEAVLAVTNVRSVCVKTGGVTGELRKPQIKVIAGDKNTEVCHFENSVYFVFDIDKIMFAKGNVAERGRLPKQVKMDEVVVDMFVGIGYFSVPIAKIARPKKIYAIDLNPDSIKYLNKTLEKNKLNNVEVFEGDSKEIVDELVAKGVKADRVLLGYLPPPVESVQYAMKIIKKGGLIHYDDLVYSENQEKDIDKTMKMFEEEAKQAGFKGVKLVNAQRVKSYRPKVDHYVLDIRVL
jgi:tRNA wybutosine-synthesizing protein 2